MAVNLFYRLVSETPTGVVYEVTVRPDDPDPVRVTFSTEERAPAPVLTGEHVAANKALRRIHARRVAEGTWPPGGVIQS